MDEVEVMRADKEWQRAGAYSVRIEGMNREHHISLREEFDEHDGDGTHYIVLLDDGYPFGTARFYEKDPATVVLGRVVILKEYRGKDFGKRLLLEIEKWAKELGYKRIDVESRTVATGFYAKSGYQVDDGKIIISGPFECIKMHKVLE